MKKIKKGFTLVELLVVIAIIAILAAIIAPNAFKAIEKSKVATAEADYKAIKTAVLGYYTDAGEWPETQTSGADPGLAVTSSNVSGWNGPYLEKWPTKNPWGGKYIFYNGNAAVNNTIKYIELTNVPLKAIERLEADLDGGALDATTKTTGTVRQDATTATTVYIIISEQ